MKPDTPTPIGKIRLTVDLPIEPKHGAKADRVFNLIRINNLSRRRQPLFIFVGDTGEECAAYGCECEEVE